MLDIVISGGTDSGLRGPWGNAPKLFVMVARTVGGRYGCSRFTANTWPDVKSFQESPEFLRLISDALLDLDAKEAALAEMHQEQEVKAERF